MGAVALIVLIGYKVSEARKAEAQRFESQVSLQGTMPTREESLKWTLWDAKAKYYSFDLVSTNLTETAEKHTYTGQKRGGAAEDAMDRQMFGAAYDAWSRGDSFSRMETNWVCDLVITHTKPKPESDLSTLVKAECSAEKDPYSAPGILMLSATGQAYRKYSHYEIVQKEAYKVNRVVGGRPTKP